MYPVYVPGSPKVAQRPFFASLSGRLLGITVLFVLVADLLVLAPALANFERGWVRERLMEAKVAILTLEESPNPATVARIEGELSRKAVVAVAIKRANERQMWVRPAAGFNVTSVRTMDLRGEDPRPSVFSAFATLTAPADRTLRILEVPRFTDADYIEVLASEAALKRDLGAYAWTAAFDSLVLGLITGALVYASMVRSFVRPLGDLTRQILAFRDRPHDVTAAIRPSNRNDELGEAERALAAMEEQVRRSLKQRERLATLGVAVAKIAHDLRNSLSTAHLVLERLERSADPEVHKALPRLTRSLERSSALASAALRYGLAESQPIKATAQPLREAADEAAAEALALHPGVTWRNAVRPELAALAGQDQLHRLLANLIRNAAEAIARQAERTAPGVITVTATALGGRVLVHVVDNGPGLPEAVKARLFQPFAASANPGGAGLGLSIAQEFAQAHGGELRLIASSPEGTTFEIELPAAEPVRTDQPVARGASNWAAG